MQLSMHDAIHKNVRLHRLIDLLQIWLQVCAVRCRCTSLCIVVVSHCLSSFVIVTKEPLGLRTAKKTSDFW